MLLSLIHRLMAIVSLIVLAVGAYYLWSWWDLYRHLEPPPGGAVDTQVWRLWLGGALLLVSFLGRTPMLWLLGRSGDDAERFRRGAGEMLETPTGARLSVEREGPSDAPVLVFVHGWGLEAGIWWEARRRLSSRFEVVLYDLAGLGRSEPPPDRRIAIERFADDLGALVRQAAPRKVILIGHSIGGMTVLTFCRRYPELLHRAVVGVALENTTADNPARTTALRDGLYALRPVLRPLMWLDVALQPLVWAMNWQSYLSGSTHLAMRLGGFGARPTRAQLEQVARDATRNSPGIQAKGNLAMLDWRIEDELGAIDVPALVFIGGRDLVTVPSAGERIVAGLPQARAQRVADAGHLGLMERAEVYNGALEAFAVDVFTRGAQPADGRRASDPQRPGEPRREPPPDPLRPPI